MKLSVIVPVFNEERNILSVIEMVLAVRLGDNIEKEIIIVDDGSTDNTKNRIGTLNGIENLRIFYHETNKGKGAAVKTALRYATGDIVVIQDADLEYNPQDLPKLIEPIIKRETSVVYGSRILNMANSRGRLDHYMGGRLVTLITNLLYGSALTDEPTCYKAFETNLLKKFQLTENDFSWEPEITAKILKGNYKIVEVPISYRYRTLSEGKKLRYKDGIKAVFILFKYKFFEN